MIVVPRYFTTILQNKVFVLFNGYPKEILKTNSPAFFGYYFV